MEISRDKDTLTICRLQRGIKRGIYEIASLKKTVTRDVTAFLKESGRRDSNPLPSAWKDVK